MSKVRYEGPEQFRPISAWGYFGYTILFCIPILGIILLIVFALSNANINRRNYARSYFCGLFLCIVITLGLSFLGVIHSGEIGNILKNTFPALSQTIDSIEDKIPQSSKESTVNSTKKPDVNNTENKASDTMTGSDQTVTQVPKTESSAGTNEVRKEVKEAIDEYEKFFQEYVEFMEKYTSSSNTASMLVDYTKWMNQYATTMEKWEKFGDDNDLNEAEEKYYIDATIRINKLLLDTISNAE